MRASARGFLSWALLVCSLLWQDVACREVPRIGPPVRFVLPEHVPSPAYTLKRVFPDTHAPRIPWAPVGFASITILTMFGCACVAHKVPIPACFDVLAGWVWAGCHPLLNGLLAWDTLDTPHRVIRSMVAINVLVFFGFAGSWLGGPETAPLRRFMRRHFVSHVSAPVYTQLTCVFAHAGPLHIFMNMCGLEHMGHQAYASFFKECPGHFIFFYLSGGIVASLASTLHNHWYGVKRYSLGASGAICALVGLMAHDTAYQHPLPFSSRCVPGRQALLYNLLKDFFLWYVDFPLLGHVAHMAGYLFGYLYPFATHLVPGTHLAAWRIK